MRREWLRDKNHEARDFRYGPYYRLTEHLDDRYMFELHYRIYFIVLALSAWWVGQRCGFRRVRRIRKDMWSVSLPGATWYIYDECRTLPCICVYPSQNRGAPNFEIGIFGKHFFRNLRLVDSIMPWIREEVKVQRFELEKKKKIHAIKSASGIL